MAALNASARPPRPDERLSCCGHRQGPNGEERGIMRTRDRAEHELDRSRILGTNLMLHGHAGANERTAASLPKDLSERSNEAFTTHETEQRRTNGTTKLRSSTAPGRRPGYAAETEQREGASRASRRRNATHSLQELPIQRAIDVQIRTPPAALDRGSACPHAAYRYARTDRPPLALRGSGPASQRVGSKFAFTSN
ncbi:hypothetical protein AcV5_002257 [Taiwanofungus camphoratus]|nr:hypothetical protein AcV5_002257 [Antrodia cinnamomea]